MSGSDLTLAHVRDYLAGGLIHVVSESPRGMDLTMADVDHYLTGSG
jgi:hypothetical protein